MLKPPMDIGIIVSDHLQITAEERVVAGVKPDDCCVSAEESSGER